MHWVNTIEAFLMQWETCKVFLDDCYWIQLNANGCYWMLLDAIEFWNELSSGVSMFIRPEHQCFQLLKFSSLTVKCPERVRNSNTLNALVWTLLWIPFVKLKCRHFNNYNCYNRRLLVHQVNPLLFDREISNAPDSNEASHLKIDEKLFFWVSKYSNESSSNWVNFHF